MEGGGGRGEAVGVLEQLEAFVAHDRLSMEAHASLLYRRVETGMKRRVVEQKLARLRQGKGGGGRGGGEGGRSRAAGSRSGSGLGSGLGSRTATAAGPATATGSRFGGSASGGARPEVDYDSSDEDGESGDGETWSEGRRPKLQTALVHLAGKSRKQVTRNSMP